MVGQTTSKRTGSESEQADLSALIGSLEEAHTVLFLSGNELLADIVVTALASGDPGALRAAYAKVAAWHGQK